MSKPDRSTTFSQAWVKGDSFVLPYPQPPARGPPADPRGVASGSEAFDPVVAEVVDVDVAGGIDGEPHRLVEVTVGGALRSPAADECSGRRVELADPVVLELAHVEDAAVGRQRRVKRLPA